jgi:hypothetical protein
MVAHKWVFTSDNIPDVLKAAKRWTPWCAEWNEKKGKWGKIPHRADRPEFGISTTKPEQWFTYEVAERSLKRNGDKFAGLGYCMTGPHGVVAVDLDKCVDELGIVADWAQAVIDELQSYTEFSPSGTGIRIMALGATECDWTNHSVGIEVYGGHEARFLTLTGDVLPGYNEMRSVAERSWTMLQQTYAREKRTAEIIDLNVPDVIDELVLPSVESLKLSDVPRKFLASGEFDTDRSGTLHQTGIALYAAGLNDAEVFSMLVTNPFAMEVALDHRRQDNDRAMLYLWREHCVKAKPKAAAMVASSDEFEVVEVRSGEPLPLPKFKRNEKTGEIHATVDNVTMAVRRPDVCGIEIRFDIFRDEIMYSKPGRNEWQSFRDPDYMRLRIALERGRFAPVGRELIRDVVQLVASENEFDTAQLWLNGLQWDGVPRLDGFLSRYFSAEDTDYTKAVSRYIWSALAGRVLVPGIKADMSPILVGAQGRGKSSAVAAMVPGPEFFADISFHEKDADLSRTMRGCLIGEIGELRGLHTKELEGIKSFMSRTHDSWIPKYREFSVQVPRRLLFIGTTNKDEFLADETGNRRWLPVKVNQVFVDRIKADRLQLWAEARELFLASGLQYQEAEDLASAVHEDHTISDSWTEVIDDWLDKEDDLTGETPRARKFLRVTDVLVEALGFVERNITRKEENRMGTTLRTLGYTRKKVRIGGKIAWAFVPLVPLAYP